MSLKTCKNKIKTDGQSYKVGKFNQSLLLNENEINKHRSGSSENNIGTLFT